MNRIAQNSGHSGEEGKNLQYFEHPDGSLYSTDPNPHGTKHAQQ
jgi:hypothetical protein